jgi:hypothetical protein
VFKLPRIGVEAANSLITPDVFVQKEIKNRDLTTVDLT